MASKSTANGLGRHCLALFGLLASLCLVVPARSQTPSSTESVIDVKDLRECSLVTRFPGDTLDPKCLQQSLNVLTDKTGVLTRRNGYSQYNASACPTGNAPIRGMWPFFSQNGTQYLVMLSSGSMLYSPADGTCNYITGLQGAVNGTATMECVQANGQLWCTDGVDPVFSTNVTSTQAVSQAPLGYHIGTFRNRILISGVPGVGANGSGSQVYLSGELNGLDYTIPAVQLTTSPAIISVNGVNDGQIVQCLMGEFQNQYLIGRKYDLWGLSGYNLSDFALRKISSQVGCLEPRSVQEVTNVLYWLSERGVEGFTGTQINRVSYPIDANILPIIASAANTRTQTLTNQADWQSGNLTPSGAGAPMSATISPGDVVPSSWSVTESISQFPNGTLVNISSTAISGQLVLIQGPIAAFKNAGGESSDSTTNWNSNSYDNISDSSMYGNRAFTTLSGNVGCPINVTFIVKTSTVGVWVSSTVAISHGLGVTSLRLDTSQIPGTQMQLHVQSPHSPFGYTSDSALFSIGGGVNIKYKDGNPSGSNCYASWDVDESNIITTGTYTSVRYDTALSTPTWGVFSAVISSGAAISPSSPTAANIYLNTQVATTNLGTLDSQVSVLNGSKITSAQKEFIVVVDSFSVNSTTNTAPTMTSFSLSAETTGYYITPCILVSSPSSYGNLLVDGVTNGGSFTFWVSTGATCALATRTNAPWVAQTANSIITVSTTTTYLAARVLFSVDSATEVPTLQDMTFTWNNGANRPPTASARWDDRYLLFFTTNTASNAVNDHAFIYDQNQKWQLWDDENVASATLYQNTLYTGDSNSTGLIYQQDVGASDNGNPFNMTFQTADFDGGDPNMNKQFSRAYVMLASPSSGNQSVSLSCNYSLDGSSSTYSLGSVTLSEAPESTGYFVAKLPFPAGQPATGHWINLTCSYTGANGPLSVHRIRLVYSPTSWD